MITNFKDLARTPLRERALQIADAGYEAIEIESVIKQRISLKESILTIKYFDSKNKPQKTTTDLKKYDRVALIGFGKGSALASGTIAKILAKRLTVGIALDTERPNFPVQGLEFFVGTHPLPSEGNVKATQKIISLAESLGEKDLLIVFTCGGGSALATATEEELADSQLVIRALTRFGANIIELNTVRKHLSIFKGGGLAKIAYPAKVISIIASDVLGDDLSMIASGPLVLDKTKIADAETILKKYKLNPRNFKLLETPKNSKYFKNIETSLFVKNNDALRAMGNKAKELGFQAKIESAVLSGEAKSILAPLVKKIKPGEAILAGGESTVNLKMKSGKVGKGGRNQEAVLGVLNDLSNQTRIKFANIRENIRDGLGNLVVVSFASDGHDNTEAAGAVADYLTIEAGKKLKVAPNVFLSNHDSFSFFEQVHDLIYAEKNCFNVSDLMLVLRSSKE